MQRLVHPYESPDADWDDDSLFVHGTPEDTLAMASDFDNYKACLETAPQFGCVQFEAKS